MANALIFILLMGNLSNGKGVRKGSRNGSNLLLAFALLDRSRVDMTYRSHDTKCCPGTKILYAKWSCHMDILWKIANKSQAKI